MELKQNFLGAFPKNKLSQGSQLFAIVGDRQEVVAGELAHLTCETDRTVSEQDLSFADTPRIQHCATRPRASGTTRLA